MAEELVAHGHVDPSLRGTDLENEVIRQIRAVVANPKLPIHFEIDHTGDLLRRARTASRDHYPELAVLLYATWIEHLLNSFIHTACMRRRIGISEATRIIRDVSYPGKYTWLFALLSSPPLHDPHRGLLKELLDARNAFVHYKWPSYDGDTDSMVKHSEQLRRLVSRVEPLVKYLQHKHRRFRFPQGKRIMSSAKRPSMAV